MPDLDMLPRTNEEGLFIARTILSATAKVLGALDSERGEGDVLLLISWACACCARVIDELEDAVGAAE